MKNLGFFLSFRSSSHCSVSASTGGQEITRRGICSDASNRQQHRHKVRVAIHSSSAGKYDTFGGSQSATSLSGLGTISFQFPSGIFYYSGLYVQVTVQNVQEAARLIDKSIIRVEQPDLELDEIIDYNAVDGLDNEGNPVGPGKFNRFQKLVQISPLERIRCG